MSEKDEENAEMVNESQPIELQVDNADDQNNNINLSISYQQETVNSQQNGEPQPLLSEDTYSKDTGDDCNDSLLMFMWGFFFPLFWMLNLLYLFSDGQSRCVRFFGIINLLMIVVYIVGIIVLLIMGIVDIIMKNE